MSEEGEKIFFFNFPVEKPAEWSLYWMIVRGKSAVKFYFCSIFSSQYLKK